MNEAERVQLNSNIWKIYAYQVLANVWFSVPAIVLFWRENGLALFDIMVLQSFFAFAAVILEIPTGYFADWYGRKKTLVIASVFSLFGILAYSVGDSFVDFLLAQIFFAFYISLTSGTITALTFDTLQNLGREKEYQKIWGNALFFSMSILAVSGIIGGFIARISLRHTLFASIPFFGLLIPLTLSMKEPTRNKVITEKGYLRELFVIIKKYLIGANKKSKKLKWIIIYSAVIYVFNQSVLWLYQPYFELTGVDVVYFGIVFASFQMVSAVSSKYAHKLEKFLGEKYSFVMLIFLVAISYLLMSNFIFLFSFSFAFIQQFVRGYKSIVVTDYVNRLVPSDVRATMLSVESFLGRLLYASIVPLIGWVADVYSLVQALGMIGITATIFGIIFVVSFRFNGVGGE
jgi:MFS family permease